MSGRFIDAISAATQDRLKRGAEMLRTRQTYPREGRIRTDLASMHCHASQLSVCEPSVRTAGAIVPDIATLVS